MRRPICLITDRKGISFHGGGDNLIPLFPAVLLILKVYVENPAECFVSFDLEIRLFQNYKILSLKKVKVEDYVSNKQFNVDKCYFSLVAMKSSAETLIGARANQLLKMPQSGLGSIQEYASAGLLRHGHLILLHYFS